jgi:hypothetical protein
VVYGVWAYPAYPPYYYYPPGYSAGSVFFAFTVGVAVGNAMWGGCHWGGGGNVYINHNTYNNFNKTNINTGDWNHKPEHRKGVQYRDQATQQKFGKGPAQGADSREAFRGRADQGRQEMRGGADNLNGRPPAVMRGPTPERVISTPKVLAITVCSGRQAAGIPVRSTVSVRAVIRVMSATVVQPAARQRQGMAVVRVPAADAGASARGERK